MKLNIIVPCFNEEAVLPETNRQLTVLISSLLNRGIIQACDVIFIDDGSSDKTWELIVGFQKSGPFAHGIKLSHNVGHQHALWAGYCFSAGKCDAVVSVDSDLQQDISKIEDMLLAYSNGYEIVYGVRNNRATDSWFKKITAQAFYRIMNIMGTDVIPNHADYRLLGKKALHALVEYPERNIFLRGLVKTLGFKETKVFFEVKERFVGESKYSIKKMLSLAIDGITSFSVQPLRIIAIVGFAIMALSFLFGIYAILAHFCGSTIPGWTSILLIVIFLGGGQMLGIGVLGEYIGKIYKEVKRRPLYIIETTV